MTAFSTFLPSLTSAISFIWSRKTRSAYAPPGTLIQLRESHLGQDHGRDLLGRELLGLAEVLDLDLGVAVVVNDLEGPGLHVLLDGGVIEAAADQTPEK